MTLFGPDGSKWQAGIKLTAADWDAVDFGIWRCVHQTGAKDATFEWAKREFLDHRKPFCAYVWAFGDPVDQAGDVAAAVMDQSVPIMIDWEDLSVPADRMFRLVAELRRLGYQVPLLYTGQAYWQTMGRPILEGRGMDLVVARYGSQKADGQYEIRARYDGMMASSTAATWEFNLGGLRPVFWQYGSRIRWGDRFMDMNAFRGSHGDLAQWFKMPSFATVPPTGPFPIQRPTPAPVPPPQIIPPTGEDDDVKFRAYYRLHGSPGIFAAYDGLKVKTHIPDLGAWQKHRDQLVDAGYQIPDGGQAFGLVDTGDVDGFRALGPIIGSVPDGCDPFGVPLG